MGTRRWRRVGVLIGSLVLTMAVSTPESPASATHRAGPDHHHPVPRASHPWPVGTAADLELSNPYFTAPFTVASNPYTFGQDPSWTPDGRVLSAEKSSSGVEQVYVSQLNGSQISCLTCDQPGPNGFPQERPQGDWILFCSFRGQKVTLGAPCLGGIGTDLYVMRPDGSHVTRLTVPGLPFEPAGDLYDNYHPAWSPDGRQIVWTHVDYRSQQQGGFQWTILVAGFTLDPTGAPRLGNVTVVAPGGDNAYETQVWAPDGSGFLYTSFSSDGNKAIGWLNSELYFMRLYGDGASLSHPQVSHLTDDNPGWDEQAVFTPDMKDVIWMSSRASPTWYQMVVTAAQQIGFDPPGENEVFAPMFLLTIADPNFHTDLYELDLSSHAIRRLTYLDSVVPEFYFDPGGTRVLWTEGTLQHTIVGTFALAPPAPPWPVVAPVPAWVGAPHPGNGLQPAPVRRANTRAMGAAGLPPVITSSLVLLESQLTELAHRLQGLPQGPACCAGG
jgi:WD40 repeat protein